MQWKRFLFWIKVNQKKVLALVLAFACAFTMFAGAAFTDEADFAVDTDVVDTLVALGVINGYTDGSFQPDATVTRAEMAKMIYVIRTGRSDASAYNNDATTFTDITDHWARGYIKYCQSLGIIAGKSATSFDPDATVTTQEAAKMLLVTLGYNADNAGLVGTGWGAKTTALADENGLLEDVNCGTTQGMPRQYAAQLMYNAIFAPTVVLRDGEYTNMNLIGDAKNATIGEKYMDLDSVEATLSEYKDGVAKFTKLPDGESLPSFKDYTVDHSDLIGHQVRILYKESSNKNEKATIYGIFEATDYSYIDTIVGQVTDYDADDQEIKINGTKYDVADTTDFDKSVDWAKNNNSAQPVTVTLNEDGDVYKLEADGNFKVVKVSYVGSKTINAGGTFQVEDTESYDGIAKDDWVVVSKNDYSNKDVLTKADVVTGEISNVNDSDITIDGTVYTLADDDWGKAAIDDDDLGKTVDAVVVNGYIYNVETVSGVSSMSDVVYISGMEKKTSYGTDSYMAKATFADGTTADIEVVDIKGADDKSVADWKNLSGVNGAYKHNGLYAFDLDDDEYTLKAITTDDFDTADTTITTAGDDRIGNYRVNDDAVIFVEESDHDVRVLTGAQVKAWKAGTEVTEGSAAYGDKTSGLTYVELAGLKITTADVPGAAYDATYGYVVATLGQTKEDNKTYTSFSVWTGSETETVKVESTKVHGSVVKGSFVKVDGDDLYLLSAIPADDGVAYAGAVDGADAESFVIDGNEYKITDDTQVIYVDTDAVEGVEGGSIVEATDHNEAGVYEKNVYFIVDPDSDDNELLVVFVDVNNELVIK